jgi:hypothetical protein
MPSAVLASTIVALYAVNLPLGVEITALVMVGAILKVFLRRDDTRFSRLEQKVEALEADNKEQHHLKHEFRNRLAAVHYALSLVIAEARTCTCGALDTLLPVLEQITSREEPT